MPFRPLLRLLITGIIAAGALLPAVGADDRVDFVRDVQPIFQRACWSCHGHEKQEAGLRLDLRERALHGGDSGLAMVAGKVEQGLLLKYVRGDDPNTVMPPDGDRLTAREIDTLTRWIQQGLSWPVDADPATPRATAHWAFQPIERPAVPIIAGDVHNSIDAFVLSELQQQNIAPSPEADRATLIRRLSLDLLGLLPQPDEVEWFLHDPAPDAYEQLVDRLLASPHFGERWGRHWLDLARYADSDGYEKDLPRQFAWRYREWVIDAVNRDLPFDQFTVEQLAGDLLPDPALNQLLATGFHRQTLTNREGGADKKEDRVKQLVDRTNTTGAVWLGLTVGCAQCHTHKYDPISQREYFQLYAFFNQAEEADVAAPTDVEAARFAALQLAHAKKRQPLLDRLTAYRASSPVHETAVDAGLVVLEAQLAKLDAAGPKPPATKALAFAQVKQPEITQIHQRGDFLRPGAEVTATTLAVLNPLKAEAAQPTRLDLARWLLAEDNPLTRRVAVNRVWQHLFGRGLVDPPDDFGTRGALPSHPALLDWLASEFSHHAWSRKALVRLIITSAAYRRSSDARPDLHDVDPKNQWLARQNRFRLEGEIIRDLVLHTSGLLDDRIGGESIRPPLPAGVAELGYAGSVKWPESTGGDRYRRGCYIFFQRTVPYPLLMTFDSPDSNATCARRERSNTPLQSLTLLNDPTFFDGARAFGRRLRQAQPSGSPSDLARAAFRASLGREPSEDELGIAASWYDQARSALRDDPVALAELLGRKAGPDAVEEAAAVVLGRVLMNTEEFFTRE
jgi:mono/diheme cytochrome c family protein